ncbi:uncharacterized protein LOC110178973 [Drosophila serrata]|uniref:uncharacterized protein LOC110178973 n=1 Tax=Drosophila serrata TaxID=7274 RepID=UPI000A1D331A|nr:uncharacterized protein LOC110178973 [Drosophila serrata]XP_020801942.1 uncharacterized protein LOC110178973 [Drosophila serrata]
MEPQRTLTDLPFEVLDLIFKALARKPQTYWGYTDLHYSNDKLSLAETCEYLGKAFAYHSRGIYKKAMYDSSYTYISKNAWPVILSFCGSTVEEYVGSPGCCWSAEVAKAVAEYCPNLQKVKFQVYSDNGDLVLAVLHKAKSSIRSLSFGYAMFQSSGIGPNILHKFPELSQLSYLNIDPFFVDEAYEIQRFVTIEELYLSAPYSQMENPKPLNLFKILAPLKKLRLLTVVGIHVISETDEIEEIPEFPALEHFKLSCSTISMEFPSCPKLKILHLAYDKCYIEGLVCRSVLKQGEDLERLIVESRPSQYDNDSLLEVIRKFKKLRYLDVTIRKIKFDLEFVRKLMSALKENGITEEDPLELVFDEISKIDWLRHWLSHVSNPNLIKLRVF